METDRSIARLAASQHGVFTRAQALSRGLSRAACGRRVSSGAWEHIFHGVYRLEGTPRTLEQSAKAACLAFPGAVASHGAAATMLSLPNVNPLVEVTVLQSRRMRLPGIEVHRATLLDRVDRDSHEGIPITSVARTLIDLSGVLAADELEALLDHILAKRRVPLAYIRGRLEALGTRGRKGAGTLAALVAERQGRRRHADSEFQRLFTRLLIEAGIELPEFEHPVRLSDGGMVFLDAFFEDRCLGIEIDSYLHHSTLTDWSRDRTRAAELVALGIRMMSITTVELRDDRDAVLDRLRRALAARMAV